MLCCNGTSAKWVQIGLGYYTGMDWSIWEQSSKAFREGGSVIGGRNSVSNPRVQATSSVSRDLRGMLEDVERPSVEL